MNAKQRSHFRKILESLKSELSQEIDRTVHTMQDEATVFADPNDRASQESDMALELRNRDRERKLIKKIDETIARIDANEYGYCESCGVEIEDDGTIAIACVSAEGGEAARKRIQELTADVEVGKIYEGPVLRLLDFGAIVQLLPGRDGLLHISQISHERVNAVSDHLKEGQMVKVKVLEADDKGRVRLSMKAVKEQEQPAKQNS